MSIKEALESSGIPILDAEVLLGAILKKDRSWILSHEEEELSSEEQSRWQQWRDRRREGEPLAYITREKEFYGRTFFVNPSVLIPRPATEGLISLTLDFLKRGKDEVQEVDNEIVVIAKAFGDPSSVNTIVDIGTGSGCIADTLALELPGRKIIATDVSKDALDVAKKNAERLHASDRIEFLQGDLLDPIKHLAKSFVVVSNPPYIPETEKLMKDVEAFEPHQALFAGKDGMEALWELWKDTIQHPRCQGIVIECKKWQGNVLLTSAED